MIASSYTYVYCPSLLSLFLFSILTAQNISAHAHPALFACSSKGSSSSSHPPSSRLHRKQVQLSKEGGDVPGV